jgi:IclR family KDG regulon transcriptional repressor
LKTVALAHGALRELGFRTMAEPVLYRLASDTGMSAGIGVLQQGRVLLVDRVEGPGFVREVVDRKIPRGRTREQRDIGRELNVHTTALGKVLLAFLPEQQRAELLRDLVLTRRTAKTIVSKAKLVAELAQVRRQGYAEADEEEYHGVRSLGAPIYDSAHEVRAALALNGGLTEPAWNHAAALVKLIQEAAAEISKRSRFA